jgi:hypothetical protein
LVVRRAGIPVEAEPAVGHNGEGVGEFRTMSAAQYGTIGPSKDMYTDLLKLDSVIHLQSLAHTTRNGLD